jgi:exodeoxyribonuclease-3
LGYGHQQIYPAQKKGYSGVAIFSKARPDFTECGIGHPLFDGEGRVVRADFGDLTVVCVYIPSGTSGEERQALKMEFLEVFSDYLLRLRETRPHLVVCGDYNICHKPMDINHPERHTQSSGFLPEERMWLDRLIAHGFIDTFRVFNQEPEQYSWWSFLFHSREKNLGWRIDYHLITEALRSRLADAAILKHVELSDHCPVSLTLK